jgi:hypothetical protein
VSDKIASDYSGFGLQCPIARLDVRQGVRKSTTMSPPIDFTDQQRLHQLAVALREATCDALDRRWMLAQKLDESRNEIERVLMMSEIDPAEARRIIYRAEVMLDAWRSLGARTVSGA